MKFKINDKVKLPLDQEGILIEILNLPWGHTHVVKITKATLNDLDDIEHYKEEELELIKEK